MEHFIKTHLLNQIFNEDCLEGLKRIPDNSIDAVITDPPYGIAKRKPMIGKSHGKIKTINSDWDIFNSAQDYQKFTEQWIKECYRILKPTGIITVWGSRKSIFIVQPILESLFPKFLDLITWIKRDSPPNITRRGLSPSTEFCLVYCKSTSGWTFNHNDIKKYNNGKQMRNFLDIPRTMPASERTGHPAQKKIETQIFLIEAFTNKKDIILDPFCGSGTTAVAYKLLDRNFICFEKNKEYYEIILKRTGA
jgi:DNA modification methylase